MAVMERVLISDYVTLQEAARLKRVNFHSLKNWARDNDIPMRKVGNVNVVRLSDLAGYHPKRLREV